MRKTIDTDVTYPYIYCMCNILCCCHYDSFIIYILHENLNTISYVRLNSFVNNACNEISHKQCSALDKRRTRVS